MVDDEDPQGAGPRKVVTFRPRAPEPSDSTRALQASADAHARWRRRQKIARGADVAWVLVACVLAARRLGAALVDREVIGFDASVAFLLLVAVPFLRGRAILAALRGAAAWVRSLRRSRRERPREADRPSSARDPIKPLRKNEKS